MVNATAINTGFVTIQVKDDISNFVESAIISLLEWKSTESAFVSVAECQTNVNGRCNLNIELNDKLYKFQAAKNGASTITNSQIIDTTGQTFTIVLSVLDQAVVTDLEGLSATFTEFGNPDSTNISIAKLTWNDANSIVQQGCIYKYKVTGFSKQLIGQNCSSADSGELFLVSQINQTYGTYLEGVVIYNGITSVIDSLNYKGTQDISKSLQEVGLDVYLPLVFLLIGLGIGIYFGNLYISIISVIVLEWLAIALVPSVISTSIGVTVTILGALILWGMSRR